VTGLTFSLKPHGDLDWWGAGIGSKLRDAEFTMVVSDWLRDDILARYPDLRPSQIVLGDMGVDTRKWVRGSGSSTVRLPARNGCPPPVTQRATT
jgi:colanic acid/amylovoran biosynthesis glycosyltransferase